MQKSPIDTQEIVRLYVSEELTVREIATRLGRSYGQIYGILRKRVIMRRSRPNRDTDYLKVADIMRQRIISGDWPPNCKILSQQDLSLIFTVNLQTIREAVAHLRQHGYLETRPNKKGTYVRPPEHWKATLN